MFIQRLKNIFKKQDIQTQTSDKENNQLDHIHKELVNLRSDINNSNYKNILDEVLVNLQNKDYSILSIFIIPLCYWLYNLSLETINYGYWYLLKQTALGFDINPVITPPIKLIIAIFFLGIGGLIFLNLKKDNNYKKAAFILNSIMLVAGLTSFISMIFTSFNIDVTDFYNGVSPITMMLFNPIVILSCSLLTIIYFFVVNYNLKKGNQQYSSNIVILIISLWLNITCIGTIYIFDSYLQMHQSFASQSYQCTPDYIHLKSIPDIDIYRIQCDSKCFGYQVINKASKEYEIIPKVFLPEDIDYINNKNESCKKP